MADTHKYHLQRNYQASLRLHAQHWFAGYLSRYLVHPSVSLPSKAAVADVGAGTGAWLFEVARTLPETAELDAIDIDLAQLPHPKWLPSNVHSVKMDIYDPIPAHLSQKYDLLHVRYFTMVVRNGDPIPLIEQLKKLVKKGGYIQWDEGDTWSTRVTKVSDDIKSTSTEKLHDLGKSIVQKQLGSAPGWIASLSKTFEACGLTEVTIHRHERPNEIQPTLHDNFLTGYEELSGFAPNGAEIRALISEASAELAASNRGLAIVGDSLTVVGRMPLD